MQKKKVAIYCRVSTLEQAENGYSLDSQEESLVKYAESLNYKVVKVYKDPGYSGSNLNRPAITLLLDDVKHGLIDVVLVFKLDRLSRSQKDTLEIIEEFLLPNNCDLISITESFDTSTPFGRAMIGILSVFAQLERENIRERLELGKRKKAKQGGWTGTNIPWAYDYIDGKLVQNENAKDVKLAFDMYLKGYGIPTINKKIPHKSRGQIRSWLKAPTYAGMFKYKDILEPGKNIDPIVSWDDFCKVQDIMSTKSKKHGPPASKNPLAGLCFCKYCGGLITRRYTKSKTGRINEYLVCYSVAKTTRSMIVDPDCPGKFHRQDKIFPYVEEQLLSLDYDKDYYNKLSKKENDYIDYTDKILSIENKRNKLLDLYLDGNLDKELYNGKKEKLDIELDNFIKLQVEEDRKREAEIDYKNIRTTLKSDWNEMNNIQKNQIMKLLIKDIIISNSEIVINWAF